MIPATPLSLVRAAARVATANLARPALPFKLTLALTYRCQYRCSTCHIWRRTPENELTTGELLAFIRKNRTFSWVDLTGGEISLRPDLPEILAAVAAEWRELAVLHFATNGFLTDRIARTVAEVAPRLPARLVITVSTDGDEETNDRVRGMAGGYRRQVATFNALRSIPGVRVVMGMTLSEANEDAVERTLAACARDCPGFGLDDLHVNLAQVSDHFYGNRGATGVPPRAAAALAALATVVGRRKRATGPAAWLESTYLGHLRRYLETGVTPLRCHALRSSCFIDPRGIVFPCLAYGTSVGSLREHGMDLRAVWASATARRLQEAVWAGACPQCWTACDAYPTILGNALVPRGWRRTSARGRLERRPA